MLKQFLIILFVGMLSVVSAQNETSFLNALKNSDTSTMSPYLEDNVDFCLFEDQQILNKNVALSRLKEFLLTHKIVGVEVMHKGTSKDKTSQFKVVKISTPKDTFRLFIYSKGEIGTKTIKEIRIDKF